MKLSALYFDHACALMLTCKHWKQPVRMYELASAMPGFISYCDFTAADGESVQSSNLCDAASLLAWRNHP